jgi:hypothetical protein
MGAADPGVFLFKLWLSQLDGHEWQVLQTVGA